MTMVWLQLRTYVMELVTSWGEGEHSELNLGQPPLEIIVMMPIMMQQKHTYMKTTF